MQTLLENVKKCEVLAEPFPHLIVTDALPEDLCLKLTSEYPALNVITDAAEISSNQRFSLSAAQSLSRPDLSPLWRQFVRLHTSKTFFHQVLDLFGDHIRSMYPSLEPSIGKLDSLSVDVRHFDACSGADIRLDAQICVNTSVVGAPTAVRRAHVDDPHKLFTGIYYLRHPDDRATGGDLELYRFKSKLRRFKTAEIEDQYVEVVKTIAYRRNTLVMFTNGITALHGVTERAVTPFPRLFFNLVGEVRTPLFDLAKHQENSRQQYLTRIAGRARRLLQPVNDIGDLDRRVD